MTELPAPLIDRAISVAKHSPCVKSRRGAVTFLRRGELPLSFVTIELAAGFNTPPPPFVCLRNAECRDQCRYVAVHAEQMAILATSYYDRSGSEIVHVEIDDAGKLGPRGFPSCLECSKLILMSGISHVWLVGHDGTQSWTAQAFHDETLRNKGAPRCLDF